MGKGYDFALCDHKQCKVRETCKRWIAYQDAVAKDKAKYLWVLIPDSPIDSCSKYVKAE